MHEAADAQAQAAGAWGLTEYTNVQVRAKYMTLEPGANRYVKYIQNIRDIQVGFLALLMLLPTG